MSRGVIIRFRIRSRIDRIKVVFTAITLSVSISMAAEAIRPVCCSGILYPSDQYELYSQVEALINSADIAEENGTIEVLIVPNAPYVFTGQITAIGYASTRKARYNKIIIIGADNSIEKPTLYSGARLNSPLGQLPSDNELAAELISNELLDLNVAPPDIPLPQSIETQLPFIQYLFGERPVLAIGLSDLSYSEVKALGTALLNYTCGSDILVIGVTNLCESADSRSCEAMDNILLDGIKSMEIDELAGEFRQGRIRAESPAVILTILQIAIQKGLSGANVLRYANSGYITGDNHGVCGYLVATFSDYKGKDQRERLILSDYEGEYLLERARYSIMNALGITKYFPESTPVLKSLEKRAGVYLALYENGEFRGGLGSIFPGGNLIKTVEEIAVSSALNDPRYNPITVPEIDEVSIVIYVLTDIHPVEDPSDFDPEKEGLVVREGNYSAMLMPDEMGQGLTNEDLLGRTCLKAGLLSGCWRQSGCAVWAFKIQRFEEE